MDVPIPSTGEETSAESLIRRQVDCLASHVRGDVPYALFQLMEKSRNVPLYRVLQYFCSTATSSDTGSATAASASV